MEAFRRAGAESALDGPGGPGETPAYLGRAIAAPASDDNVLRRSASPWKSARSRLSTASPTLTAGNRRRSASEEMMVHAKALE
jgi:hypothetical protein